MRNNRILIGQLGCGYWGPNLLRNFLKMSSRCEVKSLCDLSPERVEYVRRQFPSVGVAPTVEAILSDREIDAVVVATPARTHFEIARAAIMAGKHVLVEKPLATTVAEVDILKDEANRRGVIVMAGHTFLYNDAVIEAKRLIDEGGLGDVRYIYSQRLNLGRIRSDIDALWNFAPHDVSIIQYWLNNPTPLAVTAAGMDYIQPGINDVSFLTLVYDSKVLANIHVSWLDPHKTRKMVIVGSKKMLVYDDTASSKLVIYQKGIERKAVLGHNMDYDGRPAYSVSYNDGAAEVPEFTFREPLEVEAAHFLDCIEAGRAPITGIPHARAVVDILERAAQTPG